IGVNGIGQPDDIVRDHRPDACTAFRQPPVLDISLLKLPGGRIDDLPPCKSGILDKKSKDILQLVAKTIGPARLIEGASGRDPAPEGLVGQPVVDEIVETLVRCCNLQFTGRIAPILPAGVQNILKTGILDGSNKLQ